MIEMLRELPETTMISKIMDTMSNNYRFHSISIISMLGLINKFRGIQLNYSKL